jgi:hypothetical protein
VDEGWFVNLPFACNVIIECQHHLTPRGAGRRAYVPTALCGVRRRAWVPVSRNPDLDRIPRCRRCGELAKAQAAESSTDQREQPAPTPPSEHRSPRCPRYQRVVI